MISSFAIAIIGFGIAAVGSALGVALAGSAASNAIARQPEAYSRIFTVFIMTAAMAEALGLFGVALAFVAAFI